MADLVMVGAGPQALALSCLQGLSCRTLHVPPPPSRLEARDGGSITPEAGADLRQAQRRGELQLHEPCEVQAARWSSGQWDIVCGGGQQLSADRIGLATGHRQGVSQHPLLQ
jgi:glycine/D-amino acid oxidase-like deaminating enzyme